MSELLPCPVCGDEHPLTREGWKNQTAIIRAKVAYCTNKAYCEFSCELRYWNRLSRPELPQQEGE